MFETDTEARVDVIWGKVPLLTSLRASIIKQLEKTFVRYVLGNCLVWI